MARSGSARMSIGRGSTTSRCCRRSARRRPRPVPRHPPRSHPARESRHCHIPGVDGGKPGAAAQCHHRRQRRPAAAARRRSARAVAVPAARGLLLLDHPPARLPAFLGPVRAGRRPGHCRRHAAGADRARPAAGSGPAGQLAAVPAAAGPGARLVRSGTRAPAGRPRSLGRAVDARRRYAACGARGGRGRPDLRPLPGMSWLLGLLERRLPVPHHAARG